MENEKDHIHTYTHTPDAEIRDLPDAQLTEFQHLEQMSWQPHQMSSLTSRTDHATLRNCHNTHATPFASTARHDKENREAREHAATDTLQTEIKSRNHIIGQVMSSIPVPSSLHDSGETQPYRSLIGETLADHHQHIGTFLGGTDDGAGQRDDRGEPSLSFALHASDSGARELPTPAQPFLHRSMQPSVLHSPRQQLLHHPPEQRPEKQQFQATQTSRLEAPRHHDQHTSTSTSVFDFERQGLTQRSLGGPLQQISQNLRNTQRVSHNGD